MAWQNVALVLVVAVSACRGIEVIENVYKGQRYSPDSRALGRFTYSSEHRTPSSSSSQLAPETRDEGRHFPYSGILEQLGQTLRDVMARGQQGAVGRNLREKEKDTQGSSEDLHYHAYPHNQHLFNLPECATQQVCNAVYKRLNMTQPLCACPSGSDPCSASFRADDQRTIELKMGGPASKAVTLIKTCEPIWSVRDCRAPRDWSILALQNTRTGKAHYLVICKCPDNSRLDGPLNHDQPTYAQVPGIRVYGMMCVKNSGRRGRVARAAVGEPKFPWWRVTEALRQEDIIQDLRADGHHPGNPTI